MNIPSIRLLAAAGLLLPAMALADKLPSTFDGFVTRIASNGDFDVGERHVLCDPQTKWERAKHLTDSPAALPDSHSVLRVGAFVYVKGESRKGAFFAKAVHVESPQSDIAGELKGKALIEQTPGLHGEGPNLSGTLWVDGYPMLVTPQTRLVAANGSDFPAAQVTTNLWASYEADRASDGTITARRIAFEPNHVDQDEQDFRDLAEPEYTPPDPAKHKPGRLKFGNHLTIKWDLIDDQAVQDYVSAVGQKLVPQYQKDLPASDPTKINFRFYAVGYGWTWQGDVIEAAKQDALDMSNGVILVPQNVLASLENEAQLAALLSRAIADVTEKQFYLHRTSVKTQREMAIIGALAGVYGTPLTIASAVAQKKMMTEVNDRADRIGLTYMVQQGYDIREAACAHRLAENLPFSNPIDPDAWPPARTRQLMEELQLDYATTDYSELTTNRGAYGAIRAKVAGRE